MLVLNFYIQVGKLIIGVDGIFSTPAVSCIIRKQKSIGLLFITIRNTLTVVLLCNKQIITFRFL